MGASEHKRCGIEDAIGRPVAQRQLPGRLRDHRLCAPEIVADLPRCQPQEAAVPVAVERNLVAGCGELGGEPGQTLDLLADEEESRAHVRLAEEIEGRRSSPRVRAVVEGEQGSIV